MESTKTVNIQDWEFIFKGSTDEYPKGYYLHKPTESKYSFERGITDMVGSKLEQDIYDMWWSEN
ncbi:MAG: hypothetical protein CMB73_05560 [Euryarchaeota archaeon]|nr:hypothetical protein [Euryarchaeota archaeon]|tara:strand:- start:113 stop:304 length:192 start_codon:yes stop_codon:yes gene_type:complete